MSIREANSMKETRDCLKCGKPMWTDRCHRICPKCAHENEGISDTRATVTADVRQFLRRVLSDELTWREGPLVGVPAAVED
jgi:uncharacterized Zn finger protein (UPF0148 family)